MKIASQYLLPPLLAFTLLGCDDSNNNNVSAEQKALNQAEKLWSEAAVDSYTYIYSRLCFCPPEEDLVVTVTEGQVTSAFYTPSGTYLTELSLFDLNTIEDFFALVQQAIDEPVASLEVVYNPDLGYPVTIAIDYDLSIADDEITHRIRDLQ
ncbi:hypothetical protein E4634_15265 [Mangrovimicrobium sediminis]|uniref:Uncharacterized protein n=1 Tax=Mangrovimicrobium sediminis TaxID=2562682 RepID=A0A4Z0LYA4_9GAMM|nr:DUF6174 domain-containing protein [Haliea sp. SAOS-164]TGD72322.1 hypothetical protein E4634_15265 [Haliea sp. SAOS-164]